MGKCVIQVEEGGGYEVKGRSGGRPRAAKAGSLSTAGPSSPAASWESGAALPHPKRQSPFSSSQQQYSLEADPAASYGQVHALLLHCASVLVITWYPAYIVVHLPDYGNLLHTHLAAAGTRLNFCWCYFINSACLSERAEPTGSYTPVCC